jgi:hypothetical protein
MCLGGARLLRTEEARLRLMMMPTRKYTYAVFVRALKKAKQPIL